jgi:RNA polymerase primary sigma factor
MKHRGWHQLDILGREYYQLHQSGYGTSIANRSPRQIEIANTIVSRALPFITSIASAVISPNGWLLSRKDGDRKVSLVEQRDTLAVDDLVQEGALGAIRAMHNYDPGKGAMSTFLAYTTASAMARAYSVEGMIRIPSWIYDGVIKIYREAPPGRLSKIEALMNPIEIKGKSRPLKMGLLTAMAVYLNLAGHYKEIHDPAGKDGDSASQDTFEGRYLKDMGGVSPEEVMSNLNKSELIKAILNTITPREKKVMELRFGIGSDTDKTLEEVGQEFFVTRERVRQIEAKALRKLRHPSKSRSLIHLLY